jgi:hypothetical protein
VGFEEINVNEPYEPLGEPSYCRSKVEEVIDDLKGLLRKKWKCFR